MLAGQPAACSILDEVNSIIVGLIVIGKSKLHPVQRKECFPNQVGRSPLHNRVTPTPNTMWLISVSKVKAQAITNWLGL